MLVNLYVLGISEFLIVIKVKIKEFLLLATLFFRNSERNRYYFDPEYRVSLRFIHYGIFPQQIERNSPEFYNNLTFLEQMGGSVDTIAKKGVLETKTEADQAILQSRKMIDNRLKDFENTLNLNIGELQKVKGKYVMAYSKDIFVQTSSTNDNVNNFVDNFVGIFSGGSIKKTIGNLLKSTFNMCCSQTSGGYYQKQNYLTVMGNMGDMFRIDYLFVSQNFESKGASDLTKSMRGTYVIVSSIDKAAIANDLNVFQIMVNKQFPKSPLNIKFALLRIAHAQTLEEINPLLLQEIQKGIAKSYDDVVIISDPPPKPITHQGQNYGSANRFNVPSNPYNKDPNFTDKMLIMVLNSLRKAKKFSMVQLIQFSHNWAKISLTAPDPKPSRKKQEIFRIRSLIVQDYNALKDFDFNESYAYKPANDVFLNYIWKIVSPKYYTDLLEAGVIKRDNNQTSQSNSLIPKRWIIKQFDFQPQKELNITIRLQLEVGHSSLSTFYPKIEISFNNQEANKLQKPSGSKAIFDFVKEQLRMSGIYSKIQLKETISNEIAILCKSKQEFKKTIRYSVGIQFKYIKDFIRIYQLQGIQGKQEIDYKDDPILKDYLPVNWFISNFADRVTKCELLRPKRLKDDSIQVETIIRTDKQWVSIVQRGRKNG